MRSINNLRKENKRVWFYLGTAEQKARFAWELAELEVRFANGSPVMPQNCSALMSVRPDGTAAYVSWMVWNASFAADFAERYSGDASKILRVDYGRYTDGETDYLIEKCWAVN